jgi:transcriptional regulator with XRE-family HTH domain
MNVALPKPIRESKESVTLRRSDWNALIEHLEDIEDMAAVAARRANEATDGVAATRRNYLTGDELQRLLDWENPVKIWREKRGLSQRELAANAGVSPSYLAEIETGQKPGSADALRALARALNTSMEALVSTNRLQIAFSHLKQLLEGGAAETEMIKEGDNLLAEFKERGAAPLDLAELKSH